MRLHVVSGMSVCALSLSLLVGCPAKNIPDPAPPPGGCASAEDVGPQVRQEKFLTAARAVRGEYIVVLRAPAPGEKSLAPALVAERLVAKYGGQVFLTYEHALRGFAIRMTPEQARALAAAPEVEYVEENGVMSISESQSEATWGIDRLDQQNLPLNQTYLYNASGKGVHAYIIDTGIRITHREFAGRAEHSFDAFSDGQKGNDCNGHGTHVAATVGGNLYGVAKGVQLHAVRVLNCEGSGSTAGVIAGVDWVANNRVAPAVANMSLGGGKSDALDDAVRRAIAAGVTFVVAAGNENQDACVRSPARTSEAITVGATSNNDQRASYSNWGRCVDVFAPGSEILSAWPTDDASTRVLNGTSMATPHVAGVAALFLERNASASPAAVTSALIDNATPGKVAKAGTCSPNRLMFSGFIGAPTLKPVVQTASDKAE
ncbi:MAG TPA: S8 family peptidase [Archangium sp.]|uniref:S8 family peptidase n=1 Tax=Archangium sp. TaxID=1872627 RepID=UPI002EDA1AD1